MEADGRSCGARDVARRRGELRCKWWQIRKRDCGPRRGTASDLELEEEEQRENGLPPEEARYAARRAFGNTTLIREQTHEAWGWAAPSSASCQDVRYAFDNCAGRRDSASSPSMTLALGIGATTAIFTLVYDVMLRPLPFAQAGSACDHRRKVAEWSNIYPTLPVSANHFTFWQQHNRSFDSIAVMQQGSAAARSRWTSVAGGCVVGHSRDLFRAPGPAAVGASLHSE